MIESNKRICKICLQIKDRIQSGKFDEKNKRWVDETGKLWNGSKCPECTKNVSKEKMRLKRIKVE